MLPTGDIKKLVPNFFDKEKYLLHYQNSQLYLRLGLKLKNISRIKIQSIIMVKSILRIGHTIKIEEDKK